MSVRQATSFICLGVLIGWASSTRAAMVNLGRWDGSIELLSDYVSAETDGSGDVGQRRENTNTRTEERITLRNTNGSLIDPRLVTFNVGGTFALSQYKQRSDVGGVRTSNPGDADLSGYDVRADILPSNQRLSGTIFANRSRNVRTRELGGRQEIDAENRGAMLRANRLYIPSELSFRRERRAQRGNFSGIGADTDERREVLRYEGRRGWVDKELTLTYELLDRTDALRPSLDYRWQYATLNMDVDFGPELNRRWRGWVRGSTRSGFSAQDRLETTQTLQIRHGRSVTTRYRYQLDDVERAGGSTRSQTASVSLDHQLYESLATGLVFSARNRSFDDGQSDAYGGNLTLRYRKRLPWSGVLNASFRGGKQRQNDDFEAAFVPQELHPFDESFAQPVFLENPNVIAGSVEVIKVSNGPPVPGCADLPGPTPLVEGIDYTLREVGGRTELVPQDCSATTPGINPGDTIAVDYQFTRGGEPVTFDTDIYQWDASIDYGWIRPFFRMMRRDQDIVSGIDRGFLTDQRRMSVGVDLNGKWERVQGSLTLETQKTDADDEAFDSDHLRARLRYTVTPRLWLSLSGGLDSSKYSLPEVRDRDIVTLQAELGYARNGNLSASAFARRRELDDSRLSEELREELGLRGDWRLGKLRVDGTISAENVQRGGGNFRDLRIMLRVRRHFMWR